MAGEFESTGGLDPAAFAADLFPKEPSAPSEGSPAAVSPPEHTPPAEGSPTPAADGAAAQAGLTPEAYDALPKSWKREMEADWKLASPAVRKYVHQRETQVTEGISGYRANAESWSKAMAPFQEALRQHPDMNMSEILATLGSNHVKMLSATPAERREHAIALARGYGVDFGTAITGQPAEDLTPAQQAYLDRKLAPLMGSVQQSHDFVSKQIQDTATKDVDTFFSDPKNEFVNEVGEDILGIMQKGQAQSLAEAYQLAVLRNPTVRPKFIASLTPKSVPPPSNASKLPNVKSSATPRSPSKAGSMDDTINSIVAKHYSS